jgi:hypothetical protein
MFTDTVDSLLNLKRLSDVDVRFFRGSGWCSARHHQHLCEQALEWEADYILILGPDQVYEEDLILRLWARVQQGCDVVTAMIPARTMVPGQEMQPFQPMAWRINEASDRKYRDPKRDADMIEVVTPAGGELQEIDVIGSGVLLFRADALKKMKRPWFHEQIRAHDYQRAPGMDSVFVWRLKKEAGQKVWLDTTIKVNHLHVFQIDETFSERFADWKAKEDSHVGETTVVSTSERHGRGDERSGVA